MIIDNQAIDWGKEDGEDRGKFVAQLRVFSPTQAMIRTENSDRNAEGVSYASPNIPITPSQVSSFLESA